MTDDATMSDDLDQVAPSRRRRLAGLVRTMVRAIFYLMIAAVAAFGAGFLIFYQHVYAMKSPVEPKADAIVVLTGGYQRIDEAVHLLSDGAGKRLLISGVNPATTGNHIRLLTRSSDDLFGCCVDIGHDALDTSGNARETARWIKSRGFKSIILVTNNYHMPRSLAELRRADGITNFISYPVMTDVGPSGLIQNPLLIRTMASEYVKYLLVMSRDWTGISI